jgi:hypothetical protein
MSRNLSRHSRMSKALIAYAGFLLTVLSFF